MPTPTLTRPNRTPPPPPVYTARDKARGLQRLVVWIVAGLIALGVVLAVLDQNGTIKKVYDGANTPESTTTWPHPLADWVRDHPAPAGLLSGN